MTLYAMRSPDGELLEHTVRNTPSETWVAGYEYIASLDRAWGGRYWKRWNASRASALRLGYKIVKVRLEQA